MGTSNEGRHLLVVVAEAADGRDFVVTVRDMTDNENACSARRDNEREP